MVKSVSMPEQAGQALPPLSRRLGLGFGGALLVIVLDQWSKLWASSNLVYRVPEAVTGWFDLMLAHNSGAAFSFLAGAGGWQRWFFAVVAIAVSAGLSVWIVRMRQGSWWLVLGLGAILGGGLGNLIDRLRFGYVVDFISVHYRDWYFPAFNLADSAITFGVALLILDMWVNHEPTDTQ